VRFRGAKLGNIWAELTWLHKSRRFKPTILAQAELELINRIAELKRQHTHRRNSRQPVCRIPPEMLTESLSFLSANDQLSIIRVCQSLRQHVVDTPGLWTHVDHIQNPAALSFVLERTRNWPVDITRICVTGPDDFRFDTLAAHMHRIRTLCLDFGPVQSMPGIGSDTRAYKAFTVTAPLLQRLSMCALRGVESDDILRVYTFFTMPASAMPRLSSLQLHGVDLDRDFFQNTQSLRIFLRSRMCRPFALSRSSEFA